MSKMEPKTDSIPNESENVITSTTTETMDTLNVSPTGDAKVTEHDAAPRTVSNNTASPTTEMKTDEGDGMNLW